MAQNGWPAQSGHCETLLKRFKQEAVEEDTQGVGVEEDTEGAPAADTTGFDAQQSRLERAFVAIM